MSLLLVIICFLSSSTFAQSGSKNNLGLSKKEMLDVSSLRFTYQVSSDELIIANELSISDKNFGVKYKNDSVFFLFDEKIIVPEFYEVINSEGKVLYTDTFDSSQILDWINKNNISQKTDLPENPELIRYVEKGILKKLFKKNKNEDKFKFCLSNKSDLWIHRYCTPFFSLKLENQTYSLLMIRAAKKVSKIYVNNEDAPLKAETKCDFETQFRFFAEWGNGQSYEIFTQTPFFPITSTEKFEAYRLRGHSNKPILLAKDIFFAQAKPSFWKSLFIDPTRPWEISTSEKQLKSFLIGQPYGVFKFTFELDKLNLPQELPSLQSQNGNATYSKTRKIKVTIPETAKVKESEQIKAINSTTFQWNLIAPKYFSENENTLSYVFNQKESLLGIQVYREAGHHITLRFTGALTQLNKISYLSGFEYATWFDDFLYINSKWTSLRWGLSFNYFFSHNGLGLDTYTTNENIRAGNVDLKFRLFPGLNYRDPAFGFTFSAMNVTYSTLNSNLLGAGFFVRQNFPVFSSRLLEKIHSFFKGDKTLDVKFNYFPMALSQNVSVRNTYELELDLRLKKARWNMAAGISKRAFEISSTNQNLNFESLFLNAGIGFFF